MPKSDSIGFIDFANLVIAQNFLYSYNIRIACDILNIIRNSLKILHYKKPGE